MHRYSVLQQHAEANGVDGVDALDTAPHTHKSGYHDDSDEVRPSLPEGGPQVQNGSVSFPVRKIRLRQGRVKPEAAT